MDGTVFLKYRFKKKMYQALTWFSRHIKTPFAALIGAIIEAHTITSYGGAKTNTFASHLIC